MTELCKCLTREFPPHYATMCGTEDNPWFRCLRCDKELPLDERLSFALIHDPADVGSESPFDVVVEVQLAKKVKRYY